MIKVVKSSFEKVLPTNVLRIGTSCNARLVDLQEYVEKLVVEHENRPIVFLIGAVSVGDPCMEVPELDDTICISNFPLSAACVCSKLCNSFETEWGVQ